MFRNVQELQKKITHMQFKIIHPFLGGLFWIFARGSLILWGGVHFLTIGRRIDFFGVLFSETLSKDPRFVLSQPNSH